MLVFFGVAGTVGSSCALHARYSPISLNILDLERLLVGVSPACSFEAERATNG